MTETNRAAVRSASQIFADRIDAGLVSAVTAAFRDGALDVGSDTFQTRYIQPAWDFNARARDGQQRVVLRMWRFRC